MAQTFKVKILTPSAIIFEGEIEKVFTTTKEGIIQFLSNHAPIIVSTITCITVIEDIKGKKTEFFTSNGVINMSHNNIVFCCDTAQLKDDIDLQKAQESKMRAEERLKEPNKYDIERVKDSLNRAKLRILLKKQSH